MKVCYFLIIALFFTSFSWAKNIHYQTLGSVHGLSQSSAISIWQDRWGRMWLGNDALNCYDGENVKVYRFSEFFKDVEDSNIHTITGNDSVLFVIAEENLIYFDFETEILHLTDIKTNAVSCNENNAFYYSGNTFYKYNWRKGESQPIITLPDSVAGVRKIQPAGNNVFWLITPVGAYIVDTEANKIINHILPHENITAIFKDSHDIIWMKCRSGSIHLSTTEGSTKQLVPQNEKDRKLFQPYIYSFAEDRKGSVWIGTLSGLFEVKRPADANANTITVLNHVLPESTISSLYLDRQGSIWIGSYYGDVRYFNPEVDNYVYYPTDESHPQRLHGAVIGDILEDKERNLYISTEGSGMNILPYGNEDFQHLTTQEGLIQNKIRSTWYDAEYDRLFISGYMRGLSYYDLKTKKVHPVQDGSLKIIFQRIIEDIIPYKDELILLTQDGLFRLNRKTLEISPLFEEEELQKKCSGIIRTIHVDEKERLWISSFEHGLLTIDLRTKVLLNTYGDGLMQDSKIPSAVLRICEDPKKGIFMTTLKGGVLGYDAQQDTFTVFNEEKHQLLSNICYNITFSWFGNLIVTTNKGISILNLQSRDQVNSTRHIRLSPSFPIVALSGDCGLYSSKYEDKIYVGGLYGLFIFSEQDLAMEYNEYSLHYSSLSLNNTPIASPSELLPKSLLMTDKITLPYNKNTIGISFASSNYLSTRANRYEYKMDGLDDRWTATDHKSIIFNSLRPGNYKLTVRETGNPNKTSQIAFTIRSPFWATIPAIIAYIFLIVITLWLIIRFSRSKALLKASLETERNEIVRIEEANRNKMDFFINISNEFRTPLTLILSQLDRLSHEQLTAGKSRLDKIKIQALRLQDLITELLDFRKMEQNNLLLKVESTDITDFLKNIFHTYSEYANERQITYKFNHIPESLHVWFDKKQMQKVIYNLLAFAFKFSPSKGLVSLSLHQRNKWIEIKVIHKGSFPEEYCIDYLLRVMNEESESIPDLGLMPEGGMGIAFSKGIIKLHKGEISMQIDEDTVTFLIRLRTGNTHFREEELRTASETPDLLPLMLPKTQEALREEDTDISTPEKRLKMILVEDDDEIRIILKEAFSLVYDVIEINDGETAYEHAIKELPDIIVGEINTPGISGIEMCHTLKTNIHTLHIPVILLSSHPTEKQHIESIRAGADDYIIKPFNIELLFLRCNYLVKHRKKMLQHDKPTNNEEDILEVTTNMRDKEFLELATNAVEENLTNPDFGTTSWSKMLGIGRTRLFNRIKHITGMTPNDYILYIKMNKSTLLLSDHTLTIAEVAYQLGFSNPAYFSKCFKKQFGVTPVDYRKKL